MLFGGEFGLASHDRHGFHTLRSERLPQLSSTTGIVQSEGQTWIGSQAGILRFRSDELERALLDPQAQAAYELFDRGDGVPGGMQIDKSAGNAAFAGPDGRLWFLTDHGIAWIDPHDIHHNPLPPPVAVSSLTAGREIYASPRDVKLPAGSANLEIDYAALSFVEPGRVRFRYKLDGVDDGWVEAGKSPRGLLHEVGTRRVSFPGHRLQQRRRVE